MVSTIALQGSATYVPGAHGLHWVHCGDVASSPVMYMLAVQGTQSLQYASAVAVHAMKTFAGSAQMVHGWQPDAAACVLNVPCGHGVGLVAPSRLNEPGLQI
jgi:hypothetical protein